MSKKFERAQGFGPWLAKKMKIMNFLKIDVSWHKMTFETLKSLFVDPKLTLRGMPEVTRRDALLLGELYFIRPRACWMAVMVGQMFTFAVRTSIFQPVSPI